MLRKLGRTDTPDLFEEALRGVGFSTPVLYIHVFLAQHGYLFERLDASKS